MPVSPHPHWTLVIFCFVLVIAVLAILMGVRRYLNEDLICISLMVTGVEHPFTYLLAICAFSLEKMSIQEVL